MFCKNCGAKLPEGARFCGSCGTKVQWQEAPVAAPQKPRRKKGSAKKFLIPLALILVLALGAVLLLPNLGGNTVYLKTRTTQVDALDEMEYNWEFDKNGNLTGYSYDISYRGYLEDQEGIHFSWEYEYEDGQIVAAEYEDNERSFELEYIYDKNGNLEAVEGNNFEGEVECDRNGRILEVNFDDIGRRGEYAYYDNGMMEEMDYTQGNKRYCILFREDGQILEKVLYYNGQKYSATEYVYTDDGDVQEMAICVYNNGEIVTESTQTTEYNSKGDIVGYAVKLENTSGKLTLECEVERNGNELEYIITKLSDQGNFTELEKGDTFMVETYDDHGNMVQATSYLNGESNTEHEYIAFKAPRNYIIPNPEFPVYFQMLGNAF